MLPTLHLGPWAVSTFTLALLAALALGAELGARQARHLGHDGEQVWRMIPWAGIAGVLGAKLYYLAVLGEPLVRGPLAALRDSGMVWYGGAFAGAAVAAWRIRRTMRVTWAEFADFGVPCLAAGHAVGRVGCFLVGDDWGLPSDLPWAIAFPAGAPPTTAASLRHFGVPIPASVPDARLFTVHPTQLYEAAGLALLAWLLWRAARRAHRPFAVLAGYLAGYGGLRFGVELLRAKDDRLAIGLTIAQCISLALLGAGVAVWLHGRTTRTAADPAPPSLLRVPAHAR